METANQTSLKTSFSSRSKATKEAAAKTASKDAAEKEAAAKAAAKEAATKEAAHKEATKAATSDLASVVSILVKIDAWFWMYDLWIFMT